jgi:hypothetical protein
MIESTVRHISIFLHFLLTLKVMISLCVLVTVFIVEKTN